MSIELDWQIVEQEDMQSDESPPPPVRPKPRRQRRTWLVLGGLVLSVIAAVAAYSMWTYRTRLARVQEPIHSVAQLEAQAVAANDLASFLSLQDPDDAAWRALQEKRFGRLERIGLVEFGWQATGVPPQPGSVRLEPDGVRLDVTYQFSVTQPMPGGPASVTLLLPQFYKQTPAGWVRAMPGADFWGRWRTSSGKRIALAYLQRDTALLEPLIPRMDKVLERVCASLPCPPQPIYVIFDDSPDSLARLGDFSFGFDDGTFKLTLPSPQLFGLPADAASRDELYRALGTRVVQALVYEASGRRLNMNDASSKEIVRWELAYAGLAGPFNPTIVGTLAASVRAGVRRPLSTLQLRSRSTEALIPLALTFLGRQVSADSVSRMIPAIGTSLTLGEAISKTLGVDPAKLEPAWQEYLREQADLSVASQPVLPAPEGELALSCTSDGMKTTSIWRVRTDGTGLTRIVPNDQNTWVIAWSPDGQRLAYMGRNHVAVMDANDQVTNVQAQGWVGWLPDGRLWVYNFDDEGPDGDARLIDLETGQDIAITGTGHIWSPDGTRVAYISGAEPTIWVADAEGRNPQRVAEGTGLTWSPDGKRLAFWGRLRFEPVGTYTRTVATAIQVVDLRSGAVKTVARIADLLPPDSGQDRGSEINSLTWSPDGSVLAAGIYGRNESLVVILDANTGAVRAQQRGTLVPLPMPFLRTWSPDGRYLIFWVPSDTLSENQEGEIAIWDVRTGQSVTLPGIGLWDWSPDGKWLAVAQLGKGVLLTTPDLSSQQWPVEGMSCINVIWRPES